MKYIFRLCNLVILGVILQGLYFLLLVYTLANLSPLMYFIMSAFGIFCVFFIISGRDTAVYRLSWSVAILLFPAVMGMVYIFCIRRKTRRKITQSRSAEDCAPYPENVNNERLARYIEKTTGTPPATYTDAEYFPVGEDFQRRFLEELNSARKYIFIEFFLIEQGKMWSEILEVLTRKLGEGVKIRVMYDGFATLYTLPRRYYKTLRKMGIECQVFNPVRRLLSFRVNTRNHRKIAVIDGTTAFCGGLNFADNYINAKPKVNTGHWKDSAVMVKGQAAWDFTLSFLAMWEFVTRESCRGGFPRPTENETYTTVGRGSPTLRNVASVWHDLPLDNESVSEQIFLNFITRANDYVYIITPYLSPSEEIMSALGAAAKAGTDVRILLPFIPDKIIPNAIAKSNYLPLLEAGVRLFEYPPGFIHSKNIVADDERAAVSTVNFDYRSLYMHHECGICFYGEKIIADIKRDFTQTQSVSHEITLEAHMKTGIFTRGARRVCRIFAPLV